MIDFFHFNTTHHSRPSSPIKNPLFLAIIPLAFHLAQSLNLPWSMLASSEFLPLKQTKFINFFSWILLLPKIIILLLPKIIIHFLLSQPNWWTKNKHTNFSFIVFITQSILLLFAPESSQNKSLHFLLLPSTECNHPSSQLFCFRSSEQNFNKNTKFFFPFSCFHRPSYTHKQQPETSSKLSQILFGNRRTKEARITSIGQEVNQSIKGWN